MAADPPGRPLAGWIGPLRVRVAGDQPLARQLSRELTTAPGAPSAVAVLAADSPPPSGNPAGSGEPSLDIDVAVGRLDEVMPDYRPTTFSAKGHMSFNGRAFFADEPVRWIGDGVFDGDRPCRIAIDGQTEPRVAGLRRRLGRTIDAHPALTYALFWAVVSVRLLHRRASFAHAAFYAMPGGAVGIGGTGGSGKTNLLFEALRQPATRYLAEDFGIVDADGIVWPSPKAVSIYSSDLGVENVNLGRYIRRLPARSRAKWFLHRHLFGTIPMVKAPLGELLEPARIGDRAPLRTFVYLVRRADPGFRVRTATPAEIADRLTQVGWRENKRLLELLRMILANAEPGSAYPRVETLVASTAEVLTSALSRADVRLAEVSATAEAAEIRSELAAQGVSLE